jgi:hypothetical protein
VDFNPPVRSSVASDELTRYSGDQPTWDTYKPHWLTRVAGGMGGFAAGWQGGAGEGVRVGKEILETPFRRKVEQWKLGLSPRTTAANVEARGNSQADTDWYRSNMLRLGAGRLNKTKSSVAYTGSMPMKRYIDPSGKVHTVLSNTKSGQLTEKTGDSTVEIGGIPSDWRAETPDRLVSAISPDSRQGYANLSAMNRNVNLPPEEKAATGAYTTQPVAETNIPLVNQQNEPVASFGTRTKSVSPVSSPKGAMTKPLTSSEADRQSSIKDMRSAFEELKTLFPRVKNTLIGKYSGRWKNIVSQWSPEWAQNLGYKNTPEEEQFIVTAKRLSQRALKEQTGVAFRPWEIAWVTENMPNFDIPLPRAEAAMKEFERGLSIMEKNRNLTPEQFFNQLGTQQPKSKARWIKVNEGTFIEDPAGSGQMRKIREGDALDPSMEQGVQ